MLGPAAARAHSNTGRAEAGVPRGMRGVEADLDDRLGLRAFHDPLPLRRTIARHGAVKTCDYESDSGKADSGKQ